MATYTYKQSSSTTGTYKCNLFGADYGNLWLSLSAAKANIPAYSKINSATLKVYTAMNNRTNTCKLTAYLESSSSSTSGTSLASGTGGGCGTGISFDISSSAYNVRSPLTYDVKSWFNSENSSAGSIKSDYSSKYIRVYFYDLTVLEDFEIGAYYEIVFDYTLPTYTVTWKNHDGTVLETDTGVENGTTPTYNGSTPTKTGYTFSGWSPTVGAISGNTTYTAQFTKNKYTIKFNANGGSGTMSDLAMTYDTAKNLTANSFTRTGYDFLGWSKSNTATTATYADKASVNNLATSGTVTLYAVWKIKTFTVTWKNYDGTTLETDTNVAYGTTPTYNGATPTQTSTAQHTYTFSGWSPAISAVTGNVTYTAQFTATVRKYTVKWYNYDGTLLETDTDVPYGTKPTYNGTTPTKPSDDYYNYGFAGWSPSITEGIQGDKNFTAQFAQTDRYYTVRWVNASAVQGAEGTLLETDEVKFNTQPDYNGSTPKHPKQDTDPALNYDFIGWSAKVTDPAKPDTELEKVKGNITYTAIYETTPKIYAITVVLFGSQSTTAYEYGTELTIEAPEIVDFHRFVKWSDGDTRRSRPVTVTGEATYQAVYERIPIPIKANLEQVTGCYIIPTTKTIVYVISGTVPTVETKADTVDDWNFLVSNTIPANGYPLEKLFINGTRVY